MVAWVFCFSELYFFVVCLTYGCVDHGQRVQNSVFECLLTAAQYVTLKAELTALIEPETDSLRFYRLGNQYKQNVEHVGVQPAYAQDSILLI